MKPLNYEYKNKKFRNIKDYFNHIKNENDPEQHNDNVCVRFGSEDLKRVSALFSKDKKFQFTGYWYDDFIYNFNSRKDFVL